jgi:carbonic anhydrase
MTSLNKRSRRLITALLLAKLSLALHAAEATRLVDAQVVQPSQKSSAAASPSKNLAEKVREATESGNLAKKRMTLIVNGKGGDTRATPALDKPRTLHTDPADSMQTTRTEKIIDLDVTVRASPATKRSPADTKTTQHRPAIATKATTVANHGKPVVEPRTPHDVEGHWSYVGETGPQAWSQLNKDFNVCAIGKRQSPINIEASTTLQGPAEPLQFNYQPSSGTVVNNGHTIQVDLTGDNEITVRNSRYKLMQFHFHTPSEERVNGQGFAMVAHLVHKNADGQLAVVAVLLEPGAANSLIHQVWTYMPLDSGDRVSVPSGLIDMNALLPKDQRYYQFMGSLTTPPCTEGVLWMVMKQPTLMSREQIKLFTQIFPNNARPVQAVNGRSVRDAQ